MGVCVGGERGGGRRGEGEGVPDRGRTVQLVPPHPGPGHLRALCAVVQLLGQGHRDGHPLMSQP